MKIRIVKTASSALAVQVIEYKNNKRIILKHIGSSHNEAELEDLKGIAEEWIKNYTQQLSIFPDDNPNKILHLNYCKFLGVKYLFYYQTLSKIQAKIGFTFLPKIIYDLVIMRIFEPASKLRSLELLDNYFGIKHNRKSFYKIATQCIELKSIVEKQVLNFSENFYSFNYDILFYDVTTLYFETFEEDELRKNGFSKDNKSQQPQILIALMVTKEGFPISYEIFPGNTFEGHTFIPVIKRFIEKNNIKEFTVVADAAMISFENIKHLNKESINYIVGARLGNLNEKLTNQICNEIKPIEGSIARFKTEKGYLICSFSKIRYRKDLYEMNKQIEKAQNIIKQPSKRKKVKFTQGSAEFLELNQSLIEKNKKMLGIKGYYTNIEEDKISNQTIIERYHELYKIEQAFRISKSDLQTRPIFHYKEEPIKLHLLICFMALVITKHIELETKVSIRKINDEMKKVTDAIILNKKINKTEIIRAEPSVKLNEILSNLLKPH